MVNVITAATPGDQNIHVMIEFLLIILTDMLKDFIHHDKLLDLLARVGALIREVSTLVHDLEEIPRNEESADEANRATLDLLEILNSSRKISNMEEIGVLKEDIGFISSFFMNAEKGLYKDLWAYILDVAYEAKDVIDSIIVRDNGILHLIFSLPITIKKMLIKEEVSKISEKIPKNKSLIVVNSTKKVENKSLTTDKIIVGFEKETNWLISKLTSGPKDLDVISITGMPGSGKTTLAYKVYNDKSVARRFDIRAWCTVGQECDKRNLLNKVYNQVTGPDSKLIENIDVADELRRHILGKRYLILLDDLWDTDTWDKLTRPFPLADNESRIILSSRDMEVGLYGKCNTDLLNLRLLRLEESWELLEKRAFGEQSLEKKKAVCLEVQNNLNPYILNSEVDVMKVIELSYDHLPLQLKPCFLYLAHYPKDTQISRDLLKMYLRAEWLVKEKRMKSVEEVMEAYLDNLIFNILRGKVVWQGDTSSSSSSSSSDLMPQIVQIYYDKEHFGPINFVLLDSKRERHSGKHLYSLRISGDKMKNRLSDACHLRDLRLLRVLFLCPSFMMVKDSLLNEIGMLNHLRFLRIETKFKSLPSSFSNLRNLESLVVTNKGSTLVLLPRIGDLVKLRVLYIDACSFYDMDTDESILIEEDSKLEKLRAIEILVLSYSKETEDIFKRFPNLQRLVFHLEESWDYSTERYWFLELDFLHELESLRVDFKSSNTNY
ncbi:putative late blight resistance protein homolog R1B-13 [Capsicum annuum]|uniref:putative late blight resistance protein homolog R1B-13 n=1 Tax=Capsicum annuum TaxID=4072 RepID=UPI001FB06452|nr:putative late blight resistance protein homolog R1B-13 [Capsicum annuum]